MCKKVISKLILEKLYKSLSIRIVGFAKVTSLVIINHLITKFLAHTINCMVSVKQKNLVLVCSEEFGKIVAVGAGSGMTG